MTGTIKPGSARAWLLAARPSTLWAALSPVVVGGALAGNDGAWEPLIFTLALAAAIAIQVGVNFANDVADAARGTDTVTRIGPKRAVSTGLLTPTSMWVGTTTAFGLAVIAGIFLIIKAGPVVLVIGVASIIAALGYTNGPAPYGYRGFGEVFVFVFFGLIATVGTRFVFDRTAPADAWLGGIAMGLLATAILVANNYRDIETDAAAGKRTLAVIVGRSVTRSFYIALIVGGVMIGPIGAVTGQLPRGATIALLAIPLSIPLIRTISRTTEGPPLIGVLKGTARLQAIIAGLLALGIAGPTG